jgi:molecular chaperone HscB
LEATTVSTLAAQDHFALLGLPRCFNLDPQALEAAWKRVAVAVHPDRFATRSAAEKRVAMQWSSQANEAYRVLKEPMLRARYLCELAGVDLQVETNTAMSSEFLFRQMAWHEQLDALLGQSRDSSARLAEHKALTAELSEAENEIIAEVGQFFDAERYDQAASRVREWMFIKKMIAQLRAID